MLNSGIVPNFQDEITWRYSDPTFLARFKYFLFIFCFAFGPIGLAFEAMMFVHASLKDSVFGIDQDLRRTFRNRLVTRQYAVAPIFALFFMGIPYFMV